MPASVHRRWTRAEVEALIELNPLQTPRYELVDGELLVTSSPGNLHQAAVFELAVALREYLIRTGLGEVFVSPSDVELEPGTLVQPERKRELYQRHVPDYWIVDLDAELVEHWRPGERGPPVLRERLEWHPAGAREPFALELAPYFARVYGRPGK